MTHVRHISIAAWLLVIFTAANATELTPACPKGQQRRAGRVQGCTLGRLRQPD
jgi:hypothetical protein